MSEQNENPFASEYFHDTMAHFEAFQAGGLTPYEMFNYLRQTRAMTQREALQIFLLMETLSTLNLLLAGMVADMEGSEEETEEVPESDEHEQDTEE